MGELDYSEFLKDNVFRSKGLYKFHAVVDETESLYLVANNRLIYSSTADDVVVQVELIAWTYDPRSNWWSKCIFNGHESLGLWYLLCVHDGKIYMLCTDLNSNPSPSRRFENFLVSVDTKAHYRVTVVKNIPYSHCDVENNKLYFVNRVNEMDSFYLESREERQGQQHKIETDLSCTRFFISNGKIFTFRGVHDLATGKFISCLYERSKDHKLSYACKTNHWLCFTAKNDFDQLHLLHATDLRWIRLHLPSKGMLQWCRVCFSPRSSRIYFVYFDSDSALVFNAKVAFFPISTSNNYNDQTASMTKFVIKSNVPAEDEKRTLKGKATRVSKTGKSSKLVQNVTKPNYFLRSMVSRK